MSFVTKNGKGHVTIPIPTDSKKEQVYKLQLRFVYGLNIGYSEWSSVCYLKSIFEPELEILNTLDETTNVLITESPEFFGKCVLPGSEIQEYYRFQLLNIFSGKTYDSGWLNHELNSSNDKYIFPELLDDFSNYRLTYSIKTKNNYEESIEEDFTTSFYVINDELNLRIGADNDFEQGAMIVNINSDVEFTGNLMLRRTSNKSNYTIWEDVSYLSVLNQKTNIVYVDYCVECGTSYKYGVQFISEDGYRSYLVKSNIKMSDFEDIFLFANGQQIKIKYNPTVSNFKRNLLETKQDTIGSKYPYILKNGYANYFSFSLGGLISRLVEADERLNRRTTLAHPESKLSSQTTNLTNENIYNERMYREKVEAFLSNGKAKLFKSPTEGNLLIYLTQTSLSPDVKLGRMIYSFTSTAYEIGSCEKIKDLISANIYNFGKFLKASEMGSQLVLFNYEGPVKNNNFDLYQFIANKDINETYDTCIRQIDYISAITLQADPDESVTVKINDMSIVVTQDGYSLNNIIDITSLKILNQSGKQIYVQGTAVASFEDNENSSNSSNMLIGNYTPKVSIGQLNNVSYVENSHIDLFEKIRATYVESSRPTMDIIYSISYLKIQSTKESFQIYVNKESKIWVTPYESTILNYPITSCSILANSAAFTADFIYNGYKSQ